MQSTDQPTRVSIPFAETGVKRTIPNDSQIGIIDGAASFTDGFPPKTFLPVALGGVPPAGADFNGLFNMMTNIQRWQSAGGMFKFDSAFATLVGGYPKGSQVLDATGTFIWRSTVENNITDPDGVGAAGWVALRSPGGAATVGYANVDTPITVEQGLDILYYGIVNVLNPKFGDAHPNGVGDATPAIQAAIDHWITVGGLLYIPNAAYNVDTLVIKDAVYRHDMRIDGAFFVCTATVARAGVFEIINSVDFNITGCAHIAGLDNTNYDMGICVRAEAGTSQATSRVNISGITVRNLKIGFGVGRYNVDYQCSEISFHGCNTFKCPTAVYNGGSQSGATYNACNLVSELNPALGVPDRCIWMEGGFVSVIGGEVVFAETAGANAILLNPCLSATYGNLYPILRIIGAHIETASQLIAIVNSRGLAAPVSDSANVAITNCGGFASGDAIAQDFIYIGDATYSGAVSVKQCNFYSPVARTAYNISSTSPTAKISVDKESFGRNFKNWLGGIYGGHVLHEMVPVIRVRTLAGFTLAAGASAVIPFATSLTTGELGRYSYGYSGGTYTVPPGGFTRLEISAYLQFTGGGTLFWGIRKNGALTAYGVGVAQQNVQFILYDLVEGNTIDIYATAAGATATFDGGVSQMFQITGAT